MKHLLDIGIEGRIHWLHPLIPFQYTNRCLLFVVLPPHEDAICRHDVAVLVVAFIPFAVAFHCRFGVDIRDGEERVIQAHACCVFVKFAVSHSPAEQACWRQPLWSVGRVIHGLGFAVSHQGRSANRFQNQSHRTHHNEFPDLR